MATSAASSPAPSASEEFAEHGAADADRAEQHDPQPAASHPARPALSRRRRMPRLSWSGAPAVRSSS